MPPREIPGYIRVFNVISEPEQQKVTVVVDKNHIFEFKITGEPTWPAAPLRMHVQGPGGINGSANAFTKGFFEAFGQVGKAVEQRNQDKLQKQIPRVPIKIAPKAVPARPVPEKKTEPDSKSPK